MSNKVIVLFLAMFLSNVQATQKPEIGGYCLGNNYPNIKKPNADNFDSQYLLGTYFIGVYDGHRGAHTSGYLKEKLIAKVINSWDESMPVQEKHNAIERAFQEVDVESREQFTDGATAVLAMYDNSRLITACLGDCRAVLFSEGGDYTIVHDPHNLENSQECERILSCLSQFDKEQLANVLVDYIPTEEARRKRCNQEFPHKGEPYHKLLGQLRDVAMNIEVQFQQEGCSELSIPFTLKQIVKNRAIHGLSMVRAIGDGPIKKNRGLEQIIIAQPAITSRVISTNSILALYTCGLHNAILAILRPSKGVEGENPVARYLYDTIKSFIPGSADLNSLAASVVAHIEYTNNRVVPNFHDDMTLTLVALPAAIATHTEPLLFLPTELNDTSAASGASSTTASGCESMSEERFY